MSRVKFFICRHCGNIIEFVEDKGVKCKCCGEEMQELVPGSVDASAEKHIPVVTVVDGTNVTVKVGSVEHPMIPEHYIQWIELETEKGIQRKYLAPGEKPEAHFFLTEDRPICAYAYCNIHGLWKKDIQ